MTRRFLFLAAMCAAAAFAAPADSKPDFSGDWKLNVDKSNFGPMPPPTSATRTITQKDNLLTIDSNQTGPTGDMKVEMKLTTDGKESVNKISTPNGDIEMKTTAAFDGPGLTSKSKFEIQGMEINSTEKWSLSADGKVLTIAQTISTPQGDFELSQVYDKTTAAK